MRRLLLPIGLLVVAVAATVLAERADDDEAGADEASTMTVGSPVLSGTRIPEWLRQPESDMLLSAEVLETTKVLEAFGVPETMCVSVRRDGTVIPGHQGDVPHTPEGVQRILTVAAALDVFPPGELFTTEVVMDATPSIADGVLTGDIWIIGRGDPTLSTSTYIDRFGDERARTDIAELATAVADQLREMGITQIAGSVVADDSRYVTQFDYRNDPLQAGGTVWDADDNATNTVGPMAALLLDDGFEGFPPDLDQAANDRAPDPALRAAQVFTVLLEQEDIDVSGTARNDDAPDDRSTIASVQSPTRDDIIARALIDGTTAEMLFREIGVRVGGAEGQRFFASVSVATTLESLGVAPGKPWDGSGISDANEATCETVVSLLEHPEVGPPLRDALPLITDTELAECAPAGAEEMRVLSSAVEDVVAMAGNFTADNGDMITFAMIANHPDLAGALDGSCNPLTGTLLDAVAGHPYGPPLQELLPEPAVER